MNDFRGIVVSHYMHMSNAKSTVISLRENSHALRLASELVTSFACVSPSGETEPVRASHAVLITTSKPKATYVELGFDIGCFW